MAKIFIDPGHGGNDPGGVGNGLKEKDVVLKIAKKLRDTTSSPARCRSPSASSPATTTPAPAPGPS